MPRVAAEEEVGDLDAAERELPHQLLGPARLVIAGADLVDQHQVFGQRLAVLQHRREQAAPRNGRVDGGDGVDLAGRARAVAAELLRDATQRGAVEQREGATAQAQLLERRWHGPLRAGQRQPRAPAQHQQGRHRQQHRHAGRRRLPAAVRPARRAGPLGQGDAGQRARGRRRRGRTLHRRRKRRAGVDGRVGTAGRRQRDRQCERRDAQQRGGHLPCARTLAGQGGTRCLCHSHCRCLSGRGWRRTLRFGRGGRIRGGLFGWRALLQPGPVVAVEGLLFYARRTE